MPVYSPQLLAEWTTGQWLGPSPNPDIRGFCQDTRRLQPGDCFVALKTGQRDGHDFLPAARDAGAACALVSSARKDFDLPQLEVADPLAAFQMIAQQHRRVFTGPVVGVTGSCGKTSTKDLIAHLLGDRCLKTERNLNNTIGVPLTLTRLDPDLHRCAVVEAGINQPGEMAQLGAMIAPTVAVVTMIGPAHLEKLGSLENIAKEKAELTRLALPGAVMVVGESCMRFPVFHHFPGEIFSVCNECEANPSLDSTEYRSCFRSYREGSETRVEVHSPLLAGQFTINAHLTNGMAANVVIAVLTAILCGAQWGDIKERLADWKPAADRGAIYHLHNNFYYVDCYNANPASMSDALKTFAALAPPEQPRLYVLGGMRELGEHAEALHREVGASLALRPEDRALLIGEEAYAYAEGLRESGAQPEQIRVFEETMMAHNVVDEFSGALFFKGSRAYALENLLPAGLYQKEAQAC